MLVHVVQLTNRSSKPLKLASQHMVKNKMCPSDAPSKLTAPDFEDGLSESETFRVSMHGNCGCMVYVEIRWRWQRKKRE